MELPLDLAEMGIPIANAENKKLQEEVVRNEANIRTFQSQIEEHEDRIQALREHRKNVMQELNQVQGLYEARKQDHITEDHLGQIAERESGRLKVEMKRVRSELEGLKDQMNSHENDIYKIVQEIEDLKSQMKWDQQTLDTYLEKTSQKDEDALILQKYARQDESKIKELTLKNQALHENMIRNRKALDSERTEGIAAQIEMDKLAEEFRKAHLERQELLQQWEGTINQMKRRDAEIDASADDLAATRGEVRAKRGFIKEKLDFLEREKRNNEEVDKKIKLSEREVAKLRLDYQSAETMRIQFKDELETLKHSVNRTSTDLEAARAQSHQLVKQVEEQTAKEDLYCSQRKALQDELRRKTVSTLSAEERAQEMDEVLNIEEGNIKQLEKNVEKTREKQFKKSQGVFECKQRETVAQAELQGSYVAAKNLASKQQKLDEEALKQKEILYTQDFKLQQLEHKMSRMMGERTDEEKVQLNQKLKDLEEEWSQQHQKETLLKNQLKTLQDDLRRVDRSQQRTTKEKDVLAVRIDEINLHIDSTQRELKKLTAQKQDMMVEENILKLEVKRLREILFVHSDQVMSLEKRKLQLQTAMAERMREIDIHRDMLRAEIKTANSEKQNSSSEVHDRLSKIDKLRKRYEILMVAMAPPEGQEEEEASQTYYVIKAAQEREELQRKGDDLDAKIQKAEREIKALENTLKLMNGRNEVVRRGFTKVDNQGTEALELEQLEGKLKTLMDKFKHKRRELKQTKEDAKTMTQTLSGLNIHEDMYAARVQESQSTVKSLQKDIEDQKTKRDRVLRQCSKLQKEIRTKKGVPPHQQTEEELDIILRELQDLNLNVAQQMAQATLQHGDLTDAMKQMFAEANIPPPATPTGSRIGSRASSTARSSRSGTASLRSSLSSRGGSTPLATKSLEFGQDSVRSTPRVGMSSHSSTSSIGHKPPSSRASSKASSKVSSSSRSTPSKTLDLSIGPV